MSSICVVKRNIAFPLPRSLLKVSNSVSDRTVGIARSFKQERSLSYSKIGDTTKTSPLNDYLNYRFDDIYNVNEEYFQ